MAGEVPPLNVEILVQLSNLTTAVQEATAGLNKIGDTAKAQESKFSALKNTMLGVFAGNLMAKGAEFLGGELHNAVKAIEDTQVATEQLSTAMNNAKQNTAANREEIQKTTEKMSGLGFSTASTENAYKTLISATGSTEKATKLMAMAADLARYKHEDLATAAMTVQRATMGNARAFREFGITLDATLPKNQAIAKAMDELNGKIGGQAIGYTHTFAGEMEVLKAKFDDVAVKVGAVVMPILTKLLDLIIQVIIPAIVKLYDVTIGAWIKQLINLWNTHEGLRKVIVNVIEIVIAAFGYLLGAIAKVVDTVAKIPILGAPFKAMGKEIDGAALSVGKFAGTLDGLANKKIVLPTLGSALATSGSTSAGGDTGITGNVAGGNIDKAAAKAEKALAARNATIKKYDDELVTLQDKVNTVLLDRQTKMDDAQKTLDDKRLAAQTKYDNAVENITTTFQDKTTAAQDAYNSATEAAQQSHTDNLLSIQQKYADNATALTQKANDQRGAILNQSIALMTSAFETSTKIDLGNLFTTGGSSAAGLKDQLKSQLDDVLQLQKDVGLLSAQGYNQSFIDEVISQGPKAGDALAKSVLDSTPETQSAIKTLYDQINSVSQSGVTDLATKMNDGVHFANQKLAEQFADVGAQLDFDLKKNSADLQQALGDENDKFNAAMVNAKTTLDKAIQSATEARDLALKKAQDTLDASLLSAQDAFNKSVKAISESTMKELDALTAKILAVQAQLAALGVASSGSSGGGYVVPTQKVTSSIIPVTTPAAVGGNQFGSITINNNNNGVTTSPAEIATATLNAVILGQTQGITSNGQATSSMANKINQMSYN